ncbi:MAG: site-specific integrase [Oscillospiraceae bacterium]|nr:site-specific integrase [Oscillospiraceae bacterium]
MAGKRKDKKGRVLKDGESQRQNGTYCYRYTDRNKNRHCVYAKTLDELRRKEESVQRDLLDDIDYVAGGCTVAELVDRYVNLKRGLKQNSMRAYSSAINRIHREPFGQRKIRSVKLSDAKGYYVELHDLGLKRNTISVIHCVLRPAFEMAVDDDIIRKNPFKFKLSDILPNDAYVRKALTKEQQDRYLNFVRDYGGDSFYDEIEILLGTGLRVSELYGLTLFDVDFDRRRIYVQRQLCRTADKPFFITGPKTVSGIRYIPMTDMVFLASKRAIKKRVAPKVELLVDGCSGFLFLTKEGTPKVAMGLETYMDRMYRKYVKLFGNTLPKITPHVLRHIFCTNMHQAGIDVKSLQYLMGHSNVSVTMDVYTHNNYESVEKAFERVAVNL